MRNAPNLKANAFRLRHGPMASSDSDGNNGAFFVPPVGGIEKLLVFVSDGAGWDHVSVSLPHRTPTWEEMCIVQRLFFRDDEWVIQYHPPKSDNISYHEHCLHLWRPQQGDIPTPPAWMIGPRVGQTVEEMKAEALKELGE
jgi:hypothetical protein